jgi:hypothetical protein
MGKIVLIVCFLMSCVVMRAQDTTVFSNYEARIAVYFAECFSTDSDSVKKEKANAVFKTLEEALNFSGAFGYSFSKLKNISSVTSENGKVRIFTFGIALNSGDYIYYGFTLFNNGGDVKITRLIDGSENEQHPELSDMQAQNWFGAIYYEIRQFGEKNNPVYALCGWDGADMFINRKVLEQIKFDREGNPKFGGSFPNETSNGNRRLIFSFSEKVTMSLSYYKKLKMIVADHLNAPPQYKGNPRFLGPDMSFDGYYYKGGEWFYVPDVDVKIKNADFLAPLKRIPANIIPK